MSFAVVTCHFNPCGYRRRVENYYKFREGMGKTRLLTVELAFGARPFELAGRDIIQIRDGAVLWQKERLLQLGIHRLRGEGVETVAWLDADVRFREKDWAQRIDKALDDHDVVQCFETAHQVYDDEQYVRMALPLYWHHEITGEISQHERTAGGGWAMRINAFQELYQHCILGGADIAMGYALRIAAGYGAKDNWQTVLPAFFGISQAAIDHYVAWSESLPHLKVGWAPTTIEFLPHGTLEDRQYHSRGAILADFDPNKDVGVGPSGALEWVNDKPVLHQKVQDYFGKRKEDGHDRCIL